MTPSLCLPHELGVQLSLFSEKTTLMGAFIPLVLYICLHHKKDRNCYCLSFNSEQGIIIITMNEVKTKKTCFFFNLKICLIFFHLIINILQSGTKSFKFIIFFELENIINKRNIPFENVFKFVNETSKKLHIVFFKYLY